MRLEIDAFCRRWGGSLTLGEGKSTILTSGGGIDCYMGARF